jgi:hypothetical protein
MLETNAFGSREHQPVHPGRVDQGRFVAFNRRPHFFDALVGGQYGGFGFGFGTATRIGSPLSA